VRELFPAQLADAVLRRYPADTDAQAAEAALHMFSDFRFVTPTVLTARAASKVNDVYMYRFSRVSPLNRSMWGGAGHGTEISYVFGHVSADGYEEIDQTLSHAILGAWAQFAKTGNPNGAAVPRWPAYKAPTYEVLEYGNEISVGSNADDPNVEFFQRAFETLRAEQGR
jgi:para-nitrobenzyl esterase